MPQYAQLNESGTSVIKITDVDSSVINQWISSNNPKLGSYRIVNMIAQPGFNPSTQIITQNGWTITDTDVQPVWVINTLDANAQAVLADNAEWAALSSSNVIAQCNTFLALATPTTNLQNSAALQLVVKWIKAYTKSQLGIKN